MDKINVLLLQWTSLAIMTALLISRVCFDLRELRKIRSAPAFDSTVWLRKRGTALLILFMLTMSVALSVGPIYGPVDKALGGFNLANLILRYILFASFFLLGRQSLASYRQSQNVESGARQFITGRAGIVVLALASLSVLGLFIITGHTETSTGLLAYTGIDAAHFYAIVGYAYPAYISVLSLGMAYTVFVASNGWATKVVFGLIGVGFLLFIALPVLQATKSTFTPVAYFQLFSQYIGLICISASLAIASASRVSMSPSTAR